MWALSSHPSPPQESNLCPLQWEYGALTTGPPGTSQQNLYLIPCSDIYFFKIFFLMWTIFKVFIEFATTLFLLYVLVSLAPRYVAS